MTIRWMRSPWALAACAAALLLAAVPARAQGGLYDPRMDAPAAVNAALAAARADHKLVLLDFGADWCLDCVVLERLMSDPAVHPYLAAHYHVVHVDVGQFDNNLLTVKRYGSPIEGGIPAVVVLTGSGRTVVSTRDGALESARRMDAPTIRRMLESWVALSAAARS